MASIDIGSRKQLFVDDYLIEGMTNTMQVMNPGRKAENNPVLRPERPWEGNSVRPHTVRFDEEKGLFEMRYGCALNRAHRDKDGNVVKEGPSDYDRGIICLATSEDAVHWERPNLGLVEYQGSKDNNIIPDSWTMAYSFEDPHESDPAKRFKGHFREGTTETPGMTFDFYTSPDERDWTPYEGNPIIDTSPRVGRWGPTTWMGWDPIRQVYAVYLENSLHRRGPMGKRLIGRSESPDAINYTDPETILVPDRHDTPDTEFYALPAFAYEGLYVGMLWIFRTTNTTHHPEIIFSRDGYRFERRYREPFIPRGAPADFDCTSIYVTVNMVHKGTLYTYYIGTNHRSPEQLADLGDKAVEGVGLAITPADGFVSLDGVKGVPLNYSPAPEEIAPYSEMVTRAFSFSGSQLHLNLSRALQGGGAGPR